MAQFEIIEQEGVRLVKVTLRDETIRTESGALYYMKGAITMESKSPGLGGFFKALATGEKIFRPTYTGTGDLFLEPSFGGFHIFDGGGRTWIAESGSYWASEMGISVDVHRESALTAFKSGEGFLDFQTKLSGQGTIVLQCQGAVEVVNLNNERMTVDGNYVLARSGDIQYSAQRATRSLFSSMTSGEGFVRIYEGTGTLLMAPVPYWRHRMFQLMSGLRAGGNAGGGE
ncbi:MAG: AIM24 family protein [Limisphaerales bacterium]